MVILPQSYGWGRVQETGNTMWNYPAADGSVPLVDEHLHKKDTAPDNVADCSEQRQCNLKKHKQCSSKERKKGNQKIFLMQCSPDWYLTLASRKTPWGRPGTILMTVSNNVAQCWSWGVGGWPWAGGWNNNNKSFIYSKPFSD